MTSLSSFLLWQHAQEQHTQLLQQADTCAHEIEMHAQRHRKEQPPTKREKAAILSMYYQGLPLCCRGGLANLRSIIDPCWAEYINDWAYENLGCTGNAPKEGGFQQGREKLEKFLNGEEDA